jgi:hypothetical protein
MGQDMLKNKQVNTGPQIQSNQSLPVAKFNEINKLGTNPSQTSVPHIVDQHLANTNLRDQPAIHKISLRNPDQERPDDTQPRRIGRITPSKKEHADNAKSQLQNEHAENREEMRGRTNGEVIHGAQAGIENEREFEDYLGDFVLTSRRLTRVGERWK